MKLTQLALLSAALLTMGSVQAAPNTALEKVAPYPKAETGYTRNVINLPTLKNEDNVKVELLIGKDLMVDCNRQMLGGTIETKTLQGWGYDYFVVSDVKGPMSTLMACPNQQKRKAFVRIGNINQLYRYNSKLPMVIYVPKDVQVKYRIWSASPKIQIAKEQ
ncbi:serine protease inhibitor ecotin [Neisseria sp. Ec49-e6-T10]|uniref:serine protease inhibitor ecotin n=1 Tax=Neisseria sp. Ec49-e6-T10 TaxID=3140744 RepID=UPI003EB9882C